jgi:ABC-type transport system substrate-binding protein/DNA-binding SARP family transcriptional activator
VGTLGLEFRILGPLEVRADGVAVPMGGPRQRALLALLLLSANRAISRDRLIEELMLEPPGERAERALTVQVSRLRKALSAIDGSEPRLVASPPGYVLRVKPRELDLDTFEQLLADGRRELEGGDPAAAVAAFREAQALWRGRPLADLEFEPFARLEVERLEGLRLGAVEDRMDAELELGRHAVLVPELEALVDEHPLRERLRGQLMLALYRSGRQADALGAYRTGRALLVDQLALEPGPELQQLERAILTHDPALRLKGAILTHDPAQRVERSVPPRDPTPAPPAQRLASEAPGRVRRVRRGGLLIAVALLVATIATVALRFASESSSSITAAADSVGVIDTRGDALSGVVPAGGPPGGIAVGAGAVWETDTADDQLLEINSVGDGRERVPVGRGPTGVAVGAGEVWVINQLDRTVSEINPRALAKVASFPVGNGAGAISFGDGSVWVANVTDDTVSRIDSLNGTVATIPLAGQPDGIAVGRDGVWVTSGSTGQLLLIDPHSNQVTQTIEIGGSPGGIALGHGNVWVANGAEATVSRFDPATGAVTKINVGRAPAGVAYGAGAVWVADSLDGTVARIDPQSLAVRFVHVGGAPTALAIAGNRLWTTVLAGPAAHRGGTLTVAVAPPGQAQGSSVDPAAWDGEPVWWMLGLTNDGLVTYRRVGGEAGTTLVPDLATMLPTPTDGGRTYTFQLRSGVRYSTGALVRPEDIRHEIERVLTMSQNTYPQLFYTGIVGAARCIRAPRSCRLGDGIVTDDEADTITFHLTAPDPEFLYKLAFTWADAFPAETSMRNLGRSMPPATGPYMTESVTASRGRGPSGEPFAFHTWTLVRNPRFHEWNPLAQPPGYPDKIVMTDDENPQRAVDQVERGTLDVLVSPPLNRLSELAVHYTSQLHSEPYASVYELAMNTRVPPFNNALARRALNYAISRDRIVSLAGGSFAAQPTCQVLPPTLSGYRPYCPYTLNPGPGGTWSAPAVTTAQQLVDASGTRGMHVTMSVFAPGPVSPSIRIGRYVVSVLNHLGYRGSLRVVGSGGGNFYDSRARVQIGYANWEQDYPAPSDFIDLLLSCRSFVPDSPEMNTNAAEFCNPKIDAQAQQASELQALAPGAASEAWSRIDHEITDEAPWVPLYNLRQNIATSSRVGNYQYDPFWILLFDQLWVR